MTKHAVIFFPSFPPGVGMAMVYSVFFIALYYNVILSYALTYLYYSFWKVLPWTRCDPAWANENCYVRKEGVVSSLRSSIR